MQLQGFSLIISKMGTMITPSSQNKYKVYDHTFKGAGAQKDLDCCHFSSFCPIGWEGLSVTSHQSHP